jgi:hypothetical protein
MPRGKIHYDSIVDIVCIRVPAKKTITILKIRVFWDIAPCSLWSTPRFRRAYGVHHQGDDGLDDGRSTHV